MTTQNPFALGLQAAQGFQGLRQNAQGTAQQDLLFQQQQQAMQDEQMAAQQMAERNAALQDMARQYQQSRDPNVLFEMTLQNPEYANEISTALGAVDEESRGKLLNNAFALNQMLGSSPQQAMQYWQDNLANDPAFAGLADNFEAGDIEGAINELKTGVAIVGGKEAYDSMFGGGASIGKAGTYNPRDYTVESWAAFTQGGMQDPSLLERYFPMKQVDVGGTTYFTDDQGNLFLPATGAQGQQGAALQTGTAPQSQVLTPEAQRQSEAERTAAQEEARRQAASRAEQESPEAVEMRRLKQQEVDRTKGLVDRLLQSDNLGKITGAETGVPIIGGLQSMFAQDELNDLKALLNLLTMGNLGRMSGVLSESDIKLIASAASGITTNDSGTPISEARLREILTEIKGKLENPTADQEADASEQPQSEPKVINWSDL